MKLQSLEFDPKNFRFLEQAAKSLGLGVAASTDGRYQVGRTTIANGIATGPASEVNALRFAYSQAAVKEATSIAKSKGWGVQRSSDNKITMTRGK